MVWSRECPICGKILLEDDVCELHEKEKYIKKVKQDELEAKIGAIVFLFLIIFLIFFYIS